MTPSVSIIIPTYNTAPALLKRSVKSALAQECLSELIIVDDGSREQIASYLDDVSQRSSKKITVIHKPNGGVSSARNVGIDVANGKYVAFLDADDVLFPRFLEQATETIEKYDTDIVFGCMEYSFTSGKSKLMGNPELGNTVCVITGKQMRSLMGSLFNADALARIDLNPAMYVSQCGTLYKRDAIGDVRFDERIKISEDRLFNYSVLSHCQSAAITGRVWYRYIQNQESASQRTRLAAREELLATAKAFDSLKCGDVELDNDINLGIAECFQQALQFSIARPDFPYVSNESRCHYVKAMVNETIYRQAFKGARGLTSKQRVLGFCIEHRLPRFIVAMILGKKCISSLAKAFRQGERF